MRRLLLPLSILSAAGLAGCVPDQLGKPVVANSHVRVGAPAFVACPDVPMHAQANGYSPPLGQVPFGTAVQALDFDGVYQLPESQQSKTDSLGEQRLSNTKALGAAWVRVQSSDGKIGYIANSCLVDKGLLDRQNVHGQARRDAAQPEYRRFSEDERGSQVANRGGLGTAGGCVRGKVCHDFAAIDQLIQGTPAANPQVDDAAFRRQGQLGEYK